MNYIREGFISVLKVTLKSTFFIFNVSNFIQSVQTEENYKTEGKVVYQIHYDYKSKALYVNYNNEMNTIWR
jgi:hypothetical protein